MSLGVTTNSPIIVYYHISDLHLIREKNKFPIISLPGRTGFHVDMASHFPLRNVFPEADQELFTAFWDGIAFRDDAEDHRNRKWLAMGCCYPVNITDP